MCDIVLGRVLIKSTLGVGEPNVRLSPNSGAKADIQPLRLTRETSQIT
jgi:hypothetical protein